MNGTGRQRADSEGAARGEQAAAERKLLAALCQQALSGSARDKLLARLNGHSFTIPEHEVIFLSLRQALRALAGQPEETLRHLLAAELTRRGFPDLEIEPFFEEPAPDGAEAATLVERLLPG